MRNLSINDCGTAHESKLLEIYNQFIENEKLKNGKEPTAVEKNNINMEIALAYQKILNNLKDGGSINQALDLLEKRAETTSITEISKVAIEIVGEVFENEGLFNFKMMTGEDKATAIASGILINESVEAILGKDDELTLSEPPKELDDFKDDKLADDYGETSRRARKGDKEALKAKGLMAYSMRYVNLIKFEKTEGSEAMILSLINDLSSLDDPAAMRIAELLSQKYELDVVSKDENGNSIVDKSKIEEMYRERMQKINPGKADKIISVLEDKSEYLLELGEQTSDDFETVLKRFERDALKIEFKRKYKELVDNGEVDKLDKLVETYPEIAKEVLDETVKSLEYAQQTGNKKYIDYLKDMNGSLGISISKLPKRTIEQTISAKNVDTETIVEELGGNTQLIPDSSDRER